MSANAFTTGSASNGYTLRDVTLSVYSVAAGSPTGMTVAIHAADSGGNRDLR